MLFSFYAINSDKLSLLQFSSMPCNHINLFDRSQSGLCGTTGSLEIEAVKVHDLVPYSDKVLNKLLLAVGLAVDLSNGAQLSVRAEDKVCTSTRPLLLGSGGQHPHRSLL